MGSPATPQRFTGRAGSNLPGRVRRSLDAHIESKQRYGDTLEVAKDGRVETRLARNGGLKMTKEGLSVDVSAAEGANAPINFINAVATAVTNATLTATVSALNDLLAELRRTGRMRG